MKKVILIILTLSLSYVLFGNFDFFHENPANIADRNHSQIYFPGLTFNFNFDNSLLSLDDMMMFREGHELTSGEKKILTEDDFMIDFNFKTSLLDFGHRNWNFSLDALIFADVEILDKTYSNLVFYGNDTNIEYTSHTGQGSEAFSFWKATFNYAYPKGVSLGMIPGLFPADTTSAFVEYLRDMTLYVGANVNFNYSMMYGTIVESSQEFGAMTHSAYYKYTAHLQYSDEHSIGRLTPTFGFGLKARIFEGYIHFRLDDIFMQLNYKNLRASKYEKIVIDSLFYFDPDHEPFDEENFEEELRVKNKYVKIKPSVSVGMEYTFFHKLQVMAKYINEQYSYKNGFSFGAGYQLACVPMQYIMGYDENIFYEFKTGLIFNRFEWMLGGTFYHGFFRYGTGFGLDSAVVFKF